MIHKNIQTLTTHLTHATIQKVGTLAIKNRKFYLGTRRKIE